MYSPNLKREETKVIYQDRLINFRLFNPTQDSKTKFTQLKHTDGLLNLVANKVLYIRLYSNTAGIKIDGHSLDDVNREFLAGNTPFVILENSGKFIAGAVNYLQFECIEIENSIGNTNLEIKVKINILQEKALGQSSGLTDWVPNTYYQVGDDVIGPDNRMYNCITSHTSTAQFEISNFERQGGLDEEDARLFEEILFSSGSNDDYTPQSISS